MDKEKTMNMIGLNIDALITKYKSELLDNVVPFWLNNSSDQEYGGYYTCLTRKGDVFDTDKFVWLQARQVWMFAFLYNQVEKKQEWLDHAIRGADFLKKHGHDGSYNWYFSLDRNGAALVQPYNIFSYAFAAMAFAQLSKATGSSEYADIAKESFKLVIEKQNNPKGQWDKKVPGSRDLKNFALPMILCGLSLEMEDLIEKDFLDNIIEECIRMTTEEFYCEKEGFILENIRTDGKLSNSFEGRLLNPGHAIEAMWFIMDLGVRQNDLKLIERANNIALNMLDIGWDNEYGGIFYFLDRKGSPPQELEWDQKLWWVHLESMITMLKGYQLLGEEKNLQWFEKIHDYSWSHFKDQEYPEWYGYLNRRGEVLLPLKGGKWKGCFHVPRGLMKCWLTLEEIKKLKN